MHTTTICGYRVGSGSDRAAYDDVVSADFASASRSSDAHLVAYFAISETDARSNSHEFSTTSLFNDASFEWRTYYAIETSDFSIASIVNYYIVDIVVDEEVVAHAFFACRSELSNCDEQRTSAVRTSEAFESSLHHFDSTSSVKIAHIHIETREYRHRFFHCVRYIVEFEVEEDAVAAAFDFAHDCRTFGIEKFHTDFNERFFVLEFIQKSISFSRAREVASYDYISIHILDY